MNELSYIYGLVKKNPNYSCNNLWKKGQVFNIAIILSYAIFIFFTGYTGLIVSLNIMAFIFFLYKFIITILGLKSVSKEELATKDLPTYAILLPIRNEKPIVVSRLIDNINNLNYPKELMDVIMLVDADDEYLDEIIQMEKPSHFRIVSAPAIYPFTKPKVCNLGAESTNAEIITVYDAEDKPDTDQLLKVVKKFQDDDNLDCVQCRLHYSNGNRNILTSFFTNEYLTWFSLSLKGLERIQGEFPVIPLGGTSQHLRTKVLSEVGGWDSFNVTEDADLGVRLARERKKVSIMDTRTDEIAIHQLKHWMPQRTRWQMGYMVTYLTHTSKIGRLIKDLGIKGTFHFVMNISGAIINPIITPILFIIFILSLFFDGDGNTFLQWFPMIVLIGNFLLVSLSHIIASIKKNNSNHLLAALFQPIYFLLQAISVYRAVYKLITATYTWEKTEHE